MITSSRQDNTGTMSRMIGHAAIMASDSWVLEMPGANINEGSSASSSFSFGSLFSSSSSSGSRSSSSGSRSSSSTTVNDNNRRIAKDKWYDLHWEDYIKVYRCPKRSVASQAADWAYTNYYNSSGGENKTIHIAYSVVSPIFQLTNPSYCSKLVLQAYVYGPESATVIAPEMLMLTGAAVIVPTTIPGYFLPRYALTDKGRF